MKRARTNNRNRRHLAIRWLERAWVPRMGWVVGQGKGKHTEYHRPSWLATAPHEQRSNRRKETVQRAVRLAEIPDSWTASRPKDSVFRRARLGEVLQVLKIRNPKSEIRTNSGEHVFGFRPSDFHTRF